MSSIMTIKRKIKSIETTEKITRTMKLVATANLKKNQKNFNDIKEYNKEFYNLYMLFYGETNNFHVVEKKRDKKTLWIIFSSSLGLCGSYNNNIIKEVVSKLNVDKDKIILFGKKGYTLLKSKNLESNIKYFINANNKEISYDFCDILSEKIIDLISNDEFNMVKIIYNKFINSIEFTPNILQIYPFEKPEVNNIIYDNGYISFETKPESIINSLQKQFFSIAIYGSLIETSVSENSSRRNAMDLASKNAKTIKDDYFIEYNSKRQSKITQEINEITGGFNANK